MTSDAPEVWDEIDQKIKEDVKDNTCDLAVGILLTLVLGGICLTALVIGFGSSDHKRHLTEEDLAQRVHQSSIELEWSSPVRIEQVFLLDGTQYNQRFMCDTSVGDGNSHPYYTEGHCYRVPRVGEWWKLAINARGEKYLYTIDFEKMKKEGINIHE